MKKTILALVGAMVVAMPAWACTNIIVGKKASKTGSTMISYSADSHQLYGELYYTPAADHAPGEMRKVVEWDTYKPLGEIPQPAHTYRVVGNVNEWQVTVAESTWGGDESLMDKTALIDYGSLIYIALERSKTAREALDVMTQLVAEYGYYSEGESFSIGDPNEVWVMDLIGKGTPGEKIGNTDVMGEKGAVWVAYRIPDDCIAAHANQARVHRFPQKGKKLNKKLNRYEVGDSVMFSKDLISFARKTGKYAAEAKDEDFDFSKAFGEADFTSYRGCDGRVWAIFNRFADGMDKYFAYCNAEPVSNDSILPLYVKPNRLLTHRDVQVAMADHFEGTPWDMTQDVGSGPFHCPYRWRPMTWTVEADAPKDAPRYMHERAVGTQQTGFTFVAEMRGWLPREIGVKTWFGVDDAATALFAPIYNNVSEVPECLRVGNGDILNFSWTSMFWMTSWVSQQRYTRWDAMSVDVEAVRDSLFNRWDAQEAEIDAKAQALLAAGDQAGVTALLTKYSSDEANAATECYKNLAVYLLVKYLDGNVKREKNGQFERTEYGCPAFPMQPRYSDDFYRAIVNQRGEAIRVK